MNDTYVNVESFYKNLKIFLSNINQSYLMEAELEHVKKVLDAEPKFSIKLNNTKAHWDFVCDSDDNIISAFCSNCGAGTDNASLYCSECGAYMGINYE